MRGLRAWFLRMGEFFNQERRDREFDEEIKSHLQCHIEDNIRSGMTPDEARRDAIIKLGGIEQTKERYRERRGLPGLDSFLQDLRYGSRILRKSPGFVLIAGLTLALGIGATTAIFSVVHAVLLRPLPYRQLEQIVTIWKNNVKAGVSMNEVSPANFLDCREQSQSFETMSGIEPFGFGIVDHTRIRNRYHHRWLEERGPEMVLMACIDDATSTVFGRFFSYEGTTCVFRRSRPRIPVNPTYLLEARALDVVHFRSESVRSWIVFSLKRWRRFLKIGFGICLSGFNVLRNCCSKRLPLFQAGT